jgi:RecB family endonuclease NucS
MTKWGVIEPKTLSDAAEAVSKLLLKKAWIILSASCINEYEGRAASKTTPGDKIIMIKPSGSVIVHGPKGFKPQNWQPDTSTIIASEQEGFLVIKAIRRTPRETLTLKCHQVYVIHWLEEPREGEFWMYINEHQIRDLIATNPSLIEEGLVITRVEKPIEPGFVDLYGKDREGRLVVIELKRVKAGAEAVKQLLGYIEAFQKKGIVVRPILVAPDFTESAIRLSQLSGVELKRIDLKRFYELLKEKSKPPREGTLEDFLDR